MEWKNILLDKCNALKIEIAEEDNKILFICPKMPKTSTKIELVKIIPKEQAYGFIEGMKTSTVIKLKAIVERFRIYSANISGSRDVIYTINTKKDKDDILKTVDKIFRDDGFFTSWKININGEKKLFFPTIDRNLKRDTIISNSDCMDILISLETTRTVDEFLSKI